jgi:hypothetical protein
MSITDFIEIAQTFVLAWLIAHIYTTLILRNELGRAAKVLNAMSMATGEQSDLNRRVNDFGGRSRGADNARRVEDRGDHLRRLNGADCLLDPARGLPRACHSATTRLQQLSTCDFDKRHGRFRESDLLRKLFETVVARCMKERLVDGEAFAVDASMIVADAYRRRGVAKVGGPRSDVQSSGRRIFFGSRRCGLRRGDAD